MQPERVRDGARREWSTHAKISMTQLVKWSMAESAQRRLLPRCASSLTGSSSSMCHWHGLLQALLACGPAGPGVCLQAGRAGMGPSPPLLSPAGLGVFRQGPAGRLLAHQRTPGVSSLASHTPSQPLPAPLPAHGPLAHICTPDAPSARHPVSMPLCKYLGRRCYSRNTCAPLQCRVPLVYDTTSVLQSEHMRTPAVSCALSTRHYMGATVGTHAHPFGLLHGTDVVAAHTARVSTITE